MEINIVLKYPRPSRSLKVTQDQFDETIINPFFFKVRVYFLNKTPCALQWAMQNEAKFHHVLMCPEKAFLFHGQLQDILDIRVTLK